MVHQVWDLRVKRSVQTLPEKYQVCAVAFSEAGDQVRRPDRVGSDIPVMRRVYVFALPLLVLLWQPPHVSRRGLQPPVQPLTATL
jgi:hypothetical protein